MGGTLGADGTSVVLTTTAAVAAGGFIVLTGGWFGSNTAVVSSVSGGGLTWAVDKSGGLSNSGTFICSAQAPAGLASSTAITVNFSIIVSVPTVSGMSFTGVKTSSPVDGTPLGPTNVATAGWSSGSYAIAAGSVIVAVDWTQGAITGNTATSPSVEANEYVKPSDQYGHAAEYRIESAAGSYTVDGTWDAAGSNSNIAVAYLAAAAAVDTGLAWIKA